ncbi:uncharacterized protein METZ01_LOCUS63652 [marine metagenome]|uniref:Uncharacterized protein n=1 Tax=marine metagenome TaxID=408172 RepID=A0A381T5E4_9ZZZZ
MRANEASATSDQYSSAGKTRTVFTCCQDFFRP